jgi:hypothetical protein
VGRKRKGGVTTYAGPNVTFNPSFASAVATDALNNQEAKSAAGKRRGWHVRTGNPARRGETLTWNQMEIGKGQQPAWSHAPKSPDQSRSPKPSTWRHTRRCRYVGWPRNQPGASHGGRGSVKDRSVGGTDEPISWKRTAKRKNTSNHPMRIGIGG